MATRRAAPGVTHDTVRLGFVVLDPPGPADGDPGTLNACYEALDQLGDTVFTGNTGTNLCDFNILYVPAARK